MNLSSERGLSMVELLVSTMVMMIVLGVSTTVLTKSSTMFTQQRAAMDGRNSAAASIDLLTRLLRQSQQIVPDFDGNGVFDSVVVRGDWNPRDGDMLDPYENVVFTVLDGILWKREPADLLPVSFGDRVQALTFTYTNQNGGPLPNVVARPDLIGGVTVTIVTTAAQGLPAITSSSAISVRRIK